LNKSTYTPQFIIIFNPVLRIERGAGLFLFLAFLSGTFDAL